MSFSEIIDVPGSDVIFPSLVPFLSLLELMKLRGSCQSVRRDIDGSAELTARTKESWVAFPDQSAIPSRQGQDFPSLLRVISRWFGGDKRILRGLLSGRRGKTFGGGGGETDQRETLFISPTSPLKFRNSADGALPASLVTRLSDITHVNEEEFASLSSLVEFDHQHRSFALSLINVPLENGADGVDGPEGTGAVARTDRLFARVFESPEEQVAVRIKRAAREDRDYEKRMTDRGWKGQLREGSVPASDHPPDGICCAWMIRWEVSLWDWKESAFVSCEVATVRTAKLAENRCTTEHFCAPFESDQRSDQEVFYAYAGEKDRHGVLARALPYWKPEYLKLPLSANSLRRVLSGPSGIIVARARILKFVDWCAGKKRLFEHGGRPLHCTM
uniref:Uncharacterized protein n=1 Tax=Chromera velia CCMP2878 TaxID=1169474 RepID=A0A0G4FCJ9_9ALVE|eukprot:Cvel_16375.t1-p1 / transcript=Cvel_16375.t1 / gene=Cvel_16375 / organism=Chromera_velia_CCMP2878 / gene_product=hypothetical protein / transcript_product=hypothetical protein / location=Cvel_scaffold1259:2758-3921(-) / protein_length=388 / sequence_SO=supercontig / SO=protein_coding / is_pseudo=false